MSATGCAGCRPTCPARPRSSPPARPARSKRADEPVAAALGIDPARIAAGRQVHGTELAFHDGAPGEAGEVDGHVLRSPGPVGLVYTADCLPVALAGPGGAAVLHCGWRGLAAGLIAKGAAAVGATDAAIGPGIGPCCYEVGPEVIAALNSPPTGRNVASEATFRPVGGGRVDLAGVARGSWTRRGWSGSRRRGSARAARRSCSSRTGATEVRGGRAAWSGSTGRGPEVAGLIHGIEAAKVAANLERAREVAGPGVEILAATKYVPVEEMGALAEAGVGLVGENRQQDLAAKRERWGDAFEWDFIGNLQSRKVKQLLPACRLIHSVASESALTQLGRHGGPDAEVLVEVNVAGEQGKGGVAPADLAAFLERCPVRVGGLMTMPPFSQDPEDSRRHFARLAELAAEHGLSRLSMGTSQDWQVAVEEGATIVRLGTALFI